MRFKVHSQGSYYPPALEDIESGKTWVLQGATEVALAQIIVKIDEDTELLSGKVESLIKKVESLTRKVKVLEETGGQGTMDTLAGETDG
jgi:TnpA family transposase